MEHVQQDNDGNLYSANEMVNMRMAIVNKLKKQVEKELNEEMRTKFLRGYVPGQEIS